MRIFYLNDNLDPVGKRNCRGEERVVDEVLQNFDVTAKLEFDLNLKYVSDLEVINLLDDFRAGRKVHPWHFSLNVDVRQIAIDSMWFPFTLYCASVEKRKRELQAILGAELVTVRGYDQLASGQGIFDWVNIGSPFFFASRPIDLDHTYAELVAIAERLDAWIDGLVETVTRVACDVESVTPPSYVREQYSVFICHSSRDKAFARELRSALVEKNVRVWLDEDRIAVGEDFVAALENGIAECDFVLVVLSPNFVKYGPWARQEFRLALAEQIQQGRVRVLPVLRRDCDIPPMLKTTHYADCRRNVGEGVSKLLASMRRWKTDSGKRR